MTPAYKPTTEKQRAMWKVTGSDTECRLIADLEQAEGQLGEARELLHLSKCIGQNPDSNADYYCWMHGGPKEEYCPRCAFLAGLSTVTPEGGHGRCPDKLPHDLDQPCERVGGFTGNGTPYSKCATHHGPWPSDTERCPAAMAGNVTT